MTYVINQTQRSNSCAALGTAQENQFGIDLGIDLGFDPICVYSSRPGQGTPVQP